MAYGILSVRWYEIFLPVGVVIGFRNHKKIRAGSFIETKNLSVIDVHYTKRFLKCSFGEQGWCCCVKPDYRRQAWPPMTGLPPSPDNAWIRRTSRGIKPDEVNQDTARLAEGKPRGGNSEHRNQKSHVWQLPVMGLFFILLFSEFFLSLKLIFISILKD